MVQGTIQQDIILFVFQLKYDKYLRRYDIKAVVLIFH